MLRRPKPPVSDSRIYNAEMHYDLRTLMTALAIVPPVLAALWLWILPLTPTSYGDAVLIGSVNGLALIPVLALLQWCCVGVASRLTRT
jgi:hypothetical protein